MKKLFPTLLLGALALVPTGCVQQVAMQRQAVRSNVVVLDIGHYYEPTRGGQGARTPDASKGGVIEECEFWYRYAGEVKKEIEAAGYTCIICNRGDTPTNAALAKAGKEAGVVQVKSPVPTGVYRSKHHPNRMAVGMLSADFALDQKPGCVVFLHHNSRTAHWEVYNKGAFYVNERGVKLGTVMADVMNRELLNKGLPNRDVPCGVVIRNDGRKGGGDWLNTCNESYVPAAITEVAFLSNPEHAAFLAKPENAKRYARTIGKGIVEFMKQR